MDGWLERWEGIRQVSRYHDQTENRYTEAPDPVCSVLEDSYLIEKDGILGGEKLLQ